MSISTSQSTPLNRGRPLTGFKLKPVSTLPPPLQNDPLHSSAGKKKKNQPANKTPRTPAQRKAYEQQSAANRAAEVDTTALAAAADENARKILQLTKERSSVSDARIELLESASRKQQLQFEAAVERLAAYEAYIKKSDAVAERLKVTIEAHVSTIASMHTTLQEERSTVARYATALESNSTQVQAAFAEKALSSARLAVCQLADQLADANCDIVMRDEQLYRQSEEIAKLQQCILDMRAERAHNDALRAIYGSNPRQKRSRVESEEDVEEILLDSGSVVVQAPEPSPLMSPDCVAALVAGSNLRHAFDGSASWPPFESTPAPPSIFTERTSDTDIIVPQPPPMATTFRNSKGIDSFEQIASDDGDDVAIDLCDSESDNEDGAADSVDEDVPASPSIGALTHQVAAGTKIGKVYMIVPTDAADRVKFNELKAQLVRAGITVTTSARRAPSKLNGSQVAVIFTGADDTDRGAFAGACASDWFAPVLFSGTPVMFAHRLVREIEAQRPTTVEEFTTLVANNSRGSSFCFSNDNRSVRSSSILPLWIDIGRADSRDEFLRSIITNFENKGVRVVSNTQPDSFFHSIRVTDIATFVGTLGAVFGFDL